MKKIVFSLLIIAFSFSCKKKDDPTFGYSPSSEKLELNGTIDGVQQNFTGGLNNYYLYTSYFQDSFGVYNYVANFSPKNCIDCPGSFKIIVKDKESLAQGEMPNALNTLIAGTKDFYNLKSNKIEFQSSVSSQDPINLLWNFGNGQNSTDLNPVYYYPNFPMDEVFNVCLSINNPAGCNEQICSDVPLYLSPCKAKINHQLSTTKIVFDADASNTNNNIVKWTTSNGQNAYSDKFEYYFPAGTQVEKINLNLLNADNGCNLSIQKNILIDNSFQGCVVNFDYNVIPVSLADLQGQNRIEIQYHSPNGKIYNSSLNPQENNALFEIQSTESYKQNEKGQKTIKLNLTFSGKLFHNNEFIQLENFSGAIAVAFP